MIDDSIEAWRRKNLCKCAKGGGFDCSVLAQLSEDENIAVNRIADAIARQSAIEIGGGEIAQHMIHVDADALQADAIGVVEVPK